MGRRRGGKPIHGWLVIDKPAGITSSAVVGKVRALTGAAKAGHGGTLDPQATGVLPVALGEATKTVAYAVSGAKVYRFTVRWGESRSTDDAEGEVTAESDVRPTADDIRKALPAFTGDIDQVPPVFSAVKVGGRRAYALARADKPVRLEPRRVRIEHIGLLGQPDADRAYRTARPARRRPCRLRGYRRKRHLHAQPGARPGAGAGYGRAHYGTAPHLRRTVQRRAGDFPG